MFVEKVLSKFSISVDVVPSRCSDCMFFGHTDDISCKLGYTVPSQFDGDKLYEGCRLKDEHRDVPIVWKFSIKYGDDV